MKTSTVTLSASQMFDLNGTPYELVPAPGVGRMWVPDIIIARYIPSTIAFTNTVLSFKLGNRGLEDIAGLIGDLTARLCIIDRIALSATIAGVLDPDDLLDQPITIDAATPILVGNGSLKVTTCYRLVTP